MKQVRVKLADAFLKGQRGLSHHRSSILDFVERVHSFSVNGDQIILPLLSIINQILKLLHLNLNNNVILV